MKLSIKTAVAIIITASSFQAMAEKKESFSGTRKDFSDFIETLGEGDVYCESKGFDKITNNGGGDNALNAQKGYEIGGVGPLGGIVYQIVDEDGLHGNEVTPEDFLSDFGCLGMPLRKRLEGLYNHGRDNTSDIFDGYCDGGALANTAVNYEINGLKGWYIPTQNELHALYEHATRFSGDPIGIELSEDEYWSSTVLEEGWGLGEYAITVDFNNDTPHGVATNRGRNEVYRVRLVHEF